MTVSRPFRPTFPHLLSRTFSFGAVALSVAFSLTADVHANTLADVTKLMKQGQQAQALDQVDKYLAAKPKDAQGRFLKGLLLTEMNKTGDAIAIFQKLTEDFPELPEPYNNLAVIHAAQGRYESAHRLLQQALLAQPNYVTAYENLGDLYLSMAEQAYGKALGLDSGNRVAKAKLETSRELNARIRAVR